MMTVADVGEDVMINTIGTVKNVQKSQNETWYVVDIGGSLVRVRECEIDD